MKPKVVKRVLNPKQCLLILHSKEVLLITYELDPILLGEIVSLLQKLGGIFPNEISSGLPLV